MTPFIDMPVPGRMNECMAPHTSFRVGGTVRYFLEPRDWDDINTIYDRCWRSGIRVRVLGRGCNTLVADGHHDWAVVSTRRLNWCQRDGNRVEVGSGYDLGHLVRRAEGWGLAGFEALAGIPGTVGGAVAMNAGGRYGCIGDWLVEATLAEPGGKPARVPRSRLGLDYRTSRLVDGRPLLVSASFELQGESPLGLRERRRHIVAEKRAAQPMAARSAGCVFKNPKGESAGRLIDEAGFKGRRIGDAVVSRKHANFIVNCGKATATDVLELIEIVRQGVKNIFGVWLELEIEVWGAGEERRRA
jgi:UDP-N-acetylmuramate dehydrogenase